MRECRYTAGAIELRGKRGQGAVIEGYASVYNQPYELYGYLEMIADTAFRKTTAEGDIRLLFNHDPNWPLARSKPGGVSTLGLDADDPYGWHYRGDLPTNEHAQFVFDAIERGDVDGSSFSFEILKEDWEQEGDILKRIIREVRAFDVGPVVFPASPYADVDVARAVRSCADHLGVPYSESLTIPDLRAIATDGTAAAEPQTEPQDEPPKKALDRTRPALAECDLLVVELGL